MHPSLMSVSTNETIKYTFTTAWSDLEGPDNSTMKKWRGVYVPGICFYSVIP